MAQRLVFPDEGSRLVYDPSSGRPQASTVVSLFTDSAGTVVATDLLNAGGTPFTSGQVTTDVNGLIPLFSGPVGVDTLYARVGTGGVSPVYARAGDRIAQSVAPLPARPGGTSAVADVLAHHSVKDYGAVGNGTTDDTAAFLAAITAFKADGREIYIPPGSYRLTSTVLYQTTGDADGLKMRGAGFLRTILLMDFADGTPCIQLDGASLQLYKFQKNGYLRGFQIRPAVGRTTVMSQGAGLSITGVMGLAIDLFINGIHGDGIVSPLRDDLSFNNGDPYASLYIDLESSVIESCDGVGFNGASGIGCSSVKYNKARIGKNRRGGVVAGGHNHTIAETVSIYSNGYDADFYTDGLIAANGTTVTASANALADTGPIFTSADIGKRVTGATAGRVPAGATIASINSTTSFELSAAGTPGALGLYVQRTGVKYPGVWVKKINGNTTGFQGGKAEFDGNKVANIKFEGCASGFLLQPRLISHESTFNDGELSPPVHVLFANSISGSKNTQIEIVSPYHRSEDLGHGSTLTLYDFGSNANNTDIGIRRANVPSPDNVPAAQITQIANKDNNSRVEATINSRRMSTDGAAPQIDYRWTAGRADTGCSTQGTTTVLDPNALAVDKGKSITSSDGGLPANTTIVTVTVGVGYTLSLAATTTASGLTFTIGGTISNITNTVITFNSGALDVDGLYVAGVFTAPYRGEYKIDVLVTPTSPTAARQFRLYVNKATPPGAYGIAQQMTYQCGAAGTQTITFSTALLLATGDTITIGADNNNTGVPHAVQLNTTESKLSIRAV